MEKKKVWYVTGASKGMGLAVVKELLIQGHKVAATSRRIKDLEAALGAHEHLLPLEVDLVDESSITRSIKVAHENFGRLDVIVNNAGYGTGGALEELSALEITQNFEINFFAAVKVIQQAMPYLRGQRSGHIINISSIAGFAPGIGWPVYVAAKFALSGLSEALANDLQPLGIHVTSVSPGAFRTKFVSQESVVFSESQIADYNNIRASHQKFNEMDGKQIGDPEKVAAVLLKLVASPNPPVNLFLGSDAFERANGKIEQLKAQMNLWKEVSLSTDFN